MEYGFIHPQDSARTKMWWFHGKYPSSKEAMTKDLEAFKEAGSIWASPWNLDITPYLKQGKNELKLEVTNSWNNRAIGDLLHALDERLTVDPQLFVTPDSPLQDAGLSGEVSLIYK